MSDKDGGQLSCCMTSAGGARKGAEEEQLGDIAAPTGEVFSGTLWHWAHAPHPVLCSVLGLQQTIPMLWMYSHTLAFILRWRVATTLSQPGPDDSILLGGYISLATADPPSLVNKLTNTLFYTAAGQRRAGDAHGAVPGSRVEEAETEVWATAVAAGKAVISWIYREHLRVGEEEGGEKGMNEGSTENQIGEDKGMSYASNGAARLAGGGDAPSSAVSGIEMYAPLHQSYKEGNVTYAKWQPVHLRKLAEHEKDGSRVLPEEEEFLPSTPLQDGMPQMEEDAAQGNK
ncbi:hypothetical protein C8R44DRAFT_753525 [Mycena epipterygia]|nr:hypothetical protein C8R44DRAFT_753525 [Mycena epipterygia]